MDDDLILVLSNTKEICARRVIEHLLASSQRIVRIDTDILFGKRFSLSSVEDSFRMADGERYSFDQFKSIWYRRPENVSLPPEMSSIVQEFSRNEFRTALWSFYTSLRGFWMNNPRSCRPIEHNKFLQLKEATKVGLEVPRTIISSDPEELIAFSEAQGDRLAVKVLYPTVIRDNDSDSDKFVFTNVVSTEQLRSHREAIELVPVFAQEYVEKKIELRITVVGNRIFACAIHSQDSDRTRHDWRRYDFEKVKHEKFSLPDEISCKILQLMDNLDLQYGAIDMILRPDGRFVFLEINANGQWEWIEVLAGLPISQAIADLLVNPPID